MILNGWMQGMTGGAAKRGADESSGSRVKLRKDAIKRLDLIEILGVRLLCDDWSLFVSNRRAKTREEFSKNALRFRTSIQ